MVHETRCSGIGTEDATLLVLGAKLAFLSAVCQHRELFANQWRPWRAVFAFSLFGGGCCSLLCVCPFCFCVKILGARLAPCDGQQASEQKHKQLNSIFGELQWKSKFAIADAQEQSVCVCE